MTLDPSPETRDASEVGAATARRAWAEAARPVLVEAAGRYRSLVTYKQMSAAVQEATGITSALPVARWIGGVLAEVTDECHARNEPFLSSLCVSVQGSVGEGYADAVEQARGERPVDPDEHAAQERLDCYRHWEATGLPRDGGTPLRTAHFKTVRKSGTSAPKPRVATARTATPRKTASTPRKTASAATAPPPKPIPLCPRCYIQVPASGVCDFCD